MKKMLMLLFAFSFVSGCLQTYQRQLDIKYKKVYFDFFENRTLESGLEIMLADALMEETIKQGQLQVTRKKDADLIVGGVLNSFNQQVIGRDHHQVTTHVTLILKADVELYEPDRFMPFRTFKDIEATGIYAPDVRRELLITKEEGKAASAQALAREIVHAILYRLEEPSLSEKEN